jgi:hypothetical protein
MALVEACIAMDLQHRKVFLSIPGYSSRVIGQLGLVIVITCRALRGPICLRAPDEFKTYHNGINTMGGDSFDYSR